MKTFRNAVLPLSLLLAAALGPGVAQDEAPKAPPPPRKPPRNVVEDFLSRSDVVIVKRMYSIRTFSWGSRDDSAALAVSAMHAYEADNKDQRVFAVRIEGRPRGDIAFSALLDPASARSLVSALENIIARGRENAAESPEFLEVRFALADSLECGFAQQGTTQRPFVILGAELLRTFRSSRMADLEDLKDAVALELEKLKELGADEPAARRSR